MSYKIENTSWRKSREQLLEILQKIRENPNTSLGICSQISNNSSIEPSSNSSIKFVTLFLGYVREWPLRSKFRPYPVPSPNIFISGAEAFIKAEVEGNF